MKSAALLYSLVLVSFLSRLTHATALDGIDMENHQTVNVTPNVLVESAASNDVLRCARVPVSGLSRLKLGSYSSAHRITLFPSDKIHEKSYGKIQICIHRNASLGPCQCEKNNWESIQNGIWSSVISPYEDRYIDVKLTNNLSGSLTIRAQIEFHIWRLLCLVIGLLLLVLAPIVSSWVPFYYGSSMAIGICLVIIIVLFQGMKLLPTGRKKALYGAIYSLALGAGSLLLNWLSTFVSSILVNFGFSKEMHNPVLVFLAVGIILAGAGFGYWLVRKFVVAEDGSVDVGTAQFVKWAMRAIGVTFVFQSTLDTPLAMGVLVSFLGIYMSFTTMTWRGLWDYTYFGDGSPQRWSSKRVNKKVKRAEFLSRSGTVNSRGTSWKSPRSRSPLPDSPVKDSTSPCNRGATGNPPTYYSTFHKTPNRKKFSEEEWKDFTEESTRQSVTEWASSPEFADWIMKNADRIQIHQGESSDESIGSGPDSTDENIAQSSSGRGLFKWQRHN